MKLTAKQLDCLCSPVRVDLFESIRRLQQATVAELAVEMDRTVHSLYHHLKLLTDVGLIRIKEYRRVGKRDEAIYEPVSKKLVIDKQNASRAYNEGLIKTVRIALRKAEREHRESRQQEIDNELFGILRLEAQLSAEDAELLIKKIRALGAWVRRRDNAKSTDQRTYSLTCLAIPRETD